MGDVINMTPKENQDNSERQKQVDELRARVENGEFKVDLTMLSRKIIESGALND